MLPEERVLVQNDFFRIIDYFQIYDFDWYSDHAVISASLSVHIKRTLDMPSDWIRFTKQLMKWDLEAKEKILSKISSPDVKHKLDEFCFQTHNMSQEAASAFAAIINGALKTVFRRKAITNTQSNRSTGLYLSRPNKTWMNLDNLPIPHNLLTDVSM